MDNFDIAHNEKRLFAFSDVKKMVIEKPELLIWYKKFQQVANMKNIAYKIAGYSIDQKIIEKYDKRMEFAWNEVKKYESFPTFLNGELTDKACYYLNGIKILLLTKQI